MGKHLQWVRLALVVAALLFKISPAEKNRCKFAEGKCGACCSLQFKMLLLFWSWEGFFPYLLKGRERLQVKGYLF